MAIRDLDDSLAVAWSKGHSPETKLKLNISQCMHFVNVFSNISCRRRGVM